MKKYSFIFTIIFIPCLLMAQCVGDSPNLPCCNGLIHTNPLNNQSVNTERPDMLNRFNWMTDTWKCYLPTDFGDLNGNPMFLANPFKNKRNAYLRHLNLSSYAGVDQTEEKIDYYPEDGWELLHRNMGYRPNEIATDKQIDWPYSIIYNKYTGVMRFVGFMPGGIGLHQQIITSLSFKEAYGLQTSGLLGYMGNYAQTLDKQAIRNRVANVSTAPEARQPFSTDFEMAYDPCVCNSSSELDFAFSVLKSSTVRMEGRLIGTSVPLDGSGNNPLLNTRDSFMLAVNKGRGFSTNGGMRTYSNMDALVAKYKTPETSLFEKYLYDAAKSAIGAVSKGGDKMVGGVLNTGIEYFYKKNPNFVTKMQQLKIKDTFKLEGLALLGAGANHLSTAIFPQEQKTPNIQFIEAEMSLVGEMRDTIDLPASTINIVHPGSKSSLAFQAQNPGQYAYDWHRYPAYNEALGIVAVLEQPKAKYAYSSEPYETRYDAYLKLKMTAPLKFYYNPALNVDVENTKVYAAYTTRVNKKWAADQIGDFNRVHDKATNSDYDYFVTDFVPLDCFQSMKAEMAQSLLNGTNDLLAKPEIDIKIMFLIKYKKDKYGKEKQHLLQLTFPLDLTFENASAFEHLENFVKYPYSELVENGHFSSNTTIHVWNDILVLGNITTAPGVTVNLIAGNEVIIAPNANISSGINIISGRKPTACGSSSAIPVSTDYVKTFCKDNNKYKANVPTMRENQPMDDVTNPNHHFIQSLAVVPNPFTNQLTIHFTLQEESNGSISLTNAIGQVIKVQEFAQKSVGEYQEIIATNDVAPGVYYLTLQTKRGVETKKIVKQL